MAQPGTATRSRTRRFAVGPSVLPVLWVLSGLLAASLSAAGAAGAAEGSAAPDYQGTFVKTSDNIQGAPGVSSGVYLVDAPVAGATSYLAVPRTVAGSTIWVGATVDLGSAATAEDFDGGLQISGLADGAQSDGCWAADASVRTETADGGASPRLETKLWQTNRAQACRTADSITLAVRAYQWSPPDDTLVQLTVWEEPPATGTEGLQTPSSTVTWGDLGAPGEAVPAKPGSSWSEAPDISSGSYSFHLAPGSVGVFRMPLDWGQHGQVLISSRDRVKGFDAVTTFWASPQGGAVIRPELQGAPPSSSEFGLDLDSGPATQAIATPVVNWRDRELSRGSFAADHTGLPGSYYFVVSVAAQGVPAAGLDFTLQSGYFSDYAVAAPSYAADAPPAPQVATFGDAAGKSGESSPDPEPDDGGVPWPVVMMLFGGAAIFAVAGVVALGRARRSRSVGGRA